jgi:hypothetical protein
MSKRTERREAERAARRTAFQALRQQRARQHETQQETMTQPAVNAQSEPVTESEPSHVSEAQLAANRANAQHSTGATSESGKAKSSMNALKHGLSGKTVLLPTDDADEYNYILNAYVKSCQPATEEELNLIQSIVDSTWRLQRCRVLETGILVKGEMEFSSKYEDQSPARRAQLIQVDAYLKYEKSIRNLQIQEARLHRRLEKDQAELLRLQNIRKRQEQLAAEAAQTAVNHPSRQNGFEFSTPESHTPATANSGHHLKRRAA